MKYCKKCGTLLEDSHEICIGCGADVMDPDSWSLFPLDMAETIEKDKRDVKKRGGLIAALIIVFVLLIGLIIFFVIVNINEQKAAETAAETTETTTVEEVTETVPETVEPEVVEEPEQTEETASEEDEDDGIIAPLVLEETSEEAETTETAEPAEKTVKDADGMYLTTGSVDDVAGNLMFTTVYPEDFVEKKSGINYDIYSAKFPESLVYIVGNEDNNVQMTFMSPQHYWYRKSDGKMTMSNEYNVLTYMQYLKYDGAQSYIEAMIKQSYSDIKGFKLISQEPFDPSLKTKLEAVSSDHTKELTGDIGDYAKISRDCVYAPTGSECEADIYHYEATSRQGNTIYLDFFCPVIANTLEYVTADNNDKGKITEWLLPEFIVFEAGNEELHEKYMDAFKLFICNSKLTDEFFYLNTEYSKDIEKAYKNEKEVKNLDAKLLKEYHSSYKAGSELPAFIKGIKEFNLMKPDSYSSFSGTKTVYAPGNYKTGYFSSEKDKVFVSTSEDDYPGEEYTELDCAQGTEAAPEEDKTEE